MDELYENSSVLFITGSHNIFNNFCVDRLKSFCSFEQELATTTELLTDFGIDDLSELEGLSSSNSLPFDELKRLVPTPSINGKWFCSVSYDTLSEKVKKEVLDYVNNPSINGVLAILVTGWRDSIKLLKMAKIQKSPDVNLIRLEYPTKKTLGEIIKSEFAKKDIDVTREAVELFQKRMSSQYDKYTDIINQITLGLEGTSINLSEMTQLMKNIEYFDLADLVDALLYPLQEESISSKRKAYKILKAILQDLTPSEVTKRLSKEVSRCLAFRLALNKGMIPAKVKFSVKEAKEKLKDAGGEFNVSDLRFRRIAELAQMTSLKDWLYMYLMLTKVSNRGKPDEVELRHMRVLYSLIHRQILPDTRLDNAIHIDDIIENQRKLLNSVVYTLDSQQEEN